jgi:hypothetical protein
MAKFLTIEDDELPAEAVATALHKAGHNIARRSMGFVHRSRSTRASRS